MTEETVENPYSAPQGFGEPLPSTSPGWLAMSFAVVVTLISSVCTFFCTCLGVGLACFAALGDAAVPLAILCGVGAAMVIGVFVHRVLYRLLAPKPPAPR
jgi:hypothetical protein